MSFYKKYELARLLKEGDAKTFSGVQVGSGVPVYLHMFEGGGPPDLNELMPQIEKAAGVIEVGQFAGSYYVVTEPSERFSNVGVWLQALRGAAASGERAPVTPVATPRPSPVSSQPAFVSPPVVAAPQPEPEAKPMGEFTRMFALAGNAAPAPAAPPVARAPEPLPSQPRVAEPPPVRRIPDTAPAAPVPDPSLVSRAPEPKTTPPPAASAPSPIGELGKVFGPQPGDQGGESEFTQMFGLQSVQGQAVGAAKPAPANPPAQTPATDGEFTELFRSMRPAGAQPVSGEQAIGPLASVFDPPAPPKPAEPPVSATPAVPWQEAVRKPQAGAGGLNQDREDDLDDFMNRAIPGKAIDIDAEQAKYAMSAKPDATPFRQASEFTRMFGPSAGAGGKTPAVVPDYSQQPLGASQVFALPNLQDLAAAGPRNVASPSNSGEMGEFTRMMRVPAAQPGYENPAPNYASNTPTAQPAKADPLRTLLYIVLGIVGCAAFALLAYFVLSMMPKGH